MSQDKGLSIQSTDDSPISRRAALKEIVGIAVVLAIPVGAVLATANPIPNPPRRKALNFAPLPDPVAEPPARLAEREKRRANKKKRDDRESRLADSEEEQSSSAREQRASQP